jgi:hypothetical protein
MTDLNRDDRLFDGDHHWKSPEQQRSILRDGGQALVG